jgi:hypothetical protein
MTRISGGCLCGAVRYETAAEAGVMGHCHCVDCRKSSGTGHCSHMMVPEAELTVTGRLASYERAADSGNMVTRSFCPVCGSAVLSRNSAMPGAIFLRASSLDDPEVFKPQVVVYAARAPSWDAIGGGLPSFPGMPPQGLPQG